MISHDRLLSLLDYNPGTGIFTWRVSRGQAKSGDVAGHALGEHYHQITLDYVPYSSHRLAVFYVTGEWPSLVDHKQYGEGQDAFSNLRIATPQQNRWNSPPKVGHSKWKGVTFDKGRKKCWKMAFKLPSGEIIQRRYEDEREAAEEYMFLALEHHGEFARFD
jgi:hypothetical protein